MEDIKEFDEKSEILKALAHPLRLYIVKSLMENRCNVTRIQECLGLPQSTVSQYIAKLKYAGIIEGERRGLEICYKVVSEDARKIVRALFY